jgi:hypothetical protein
LLKNEVQSALESNFPKMIKANSPQALEFADLFFSVVTIQVYTSYPSIFPLIDVVA